MPNPVAAFVPYRRGRRSGSTGSTTPAVPAAPDTPSTPSPASGAQALYTLLSWIAARQASADVYLGTSPLLYQAYASAVIADGASGYWRLGEAVGSATVADSSGGGNTGTITGGVTLGQVSPLSEGVDTAALFVAASVGKVTLSNLALAAAFTGEAWIKTTSAGQESFFSNYTGTGAGSYFGVKLGLPFLFINSGTPTTITVPGPTITDGAWHHLVFTNDGTTTAVYVDGVLRTSGAQSRGVDSATPAAIGFGVGAADYFDGTLDEVALYPTALSAAQIATHYARRTAVNATPVGVKIQRTAYVPALLPSTSYYWQIVAFNDGGRARGPVWSFTTPAAKQLLIAVAGSFITNVRAGSVTIHDPLGAAAGTAAMTFDTTAPVVGANVLIGVGSLDAANLLFGGEIQSDDLTYVDSPSSQLWPTSLIDYTFRLNKRRPFGAFAAVSATTIVRALIAAYAPGFTTNNVQTGLAAITIAFGGSDDFSACLQAIAVAIGGYYRVDPSRDVHLTLTDPGVVTPVDASSPPLNTPTPFALSTDVSQIRTRDFVVGTGTTLAAAVKDRETILPVASTLLFTSSGGQALLNGQSIAGTPAVAVLSYASASVGLPSVKPTVALAVGAGLAYGVFRYAYTDVTPSGETLPSALSTAITTGLMAGPVNGVSANAAVGTGLSAGTYNYAQSYITADGETLVGGVTSILIVDPTAPSAPAVDNTLRGYGANFFVPGDTIDVKVGYSWAGSPTVGPQLVLSAASTFVALLDVASGFASIPILTLTASTDPSVTAVILFFQINGGGYKHAYVRRVSDDFPLIYWLFGSGTLDVRIGSFQDSTMPTAQVFKSAAVTLQGGLPGITSSNLWRTAVNVAPTQASLKLVANVAGNPGTTYSDTTADGSLGASSPSVGTAVTAQVAISAVAVGPLPTSARNVYRTAVNGTPLQLQQVLANNSSTVGVTDATPDGSLGVNAPTQNTSAIVPSSATSTTNGSTAVGATSMVLVSATNFSVSPGGWIMVAGQTIRYQGISSNTVTGIPATGPGAVLVVIPTATLVVALPVLMGINANNGVTPAMAAGANINLCVQRDNLTAQAALGQLELDENGLVTDGIHEFTIVDGSCTSDALCNARGDADLALFASPIVSIAFSTRTRYRSGQTVHVNLPTLGVTGDFVIQDVTITFDGPALPRYAVRASSVKFALEDLLRRVLVS